MIPFTTNFRQKNMNQYEKHEPCQQPVITNQAKPAFALCHLCSSRMMNKQLPKLRKCKHNSNEMRFDLSSVDKRCNAIQSTTPWHDKTECFKYHRRSASDCINFSGLNHHMEDKGGALDIVQNKHDSLQRIHSYIRC